MDQSFVEPSDITTAINEERNRALEKLAKGSRDDFDYHRGMAEGLRIAVITVQAHFDRILGPEVR